MNILIISDHSKESKCWAELLSEVDEKANLEIVKIKKAKVYLIENENPDIIFIETDKEKDLYISSDLDIPSPLVVISSDASLCLSAFALNTFNYLIKPLGKEDFEASIIKYNKFYSKSIDSEFLGDIQSLVKFVSNKEKDYKKRFMIKIGNTIKSISVNDIAYFFSKDKVNYLMKAEGKKFPVENTLDEIEDMLDPEIYYRANRQFIININAIDEIHPYFKGRIKLSLTPKQDSELVISSEKSRSFKDWLNK